MKKIFLPIIICLLAIVCACTHDTSDEWVVKGTVPQDRLNGWQVFIVPCDPAEQMFTSKAFEDSIGVDSVVITDGKFEFRGKGEFLARITVDKHVRMGTQDLLIVTEPGQTVNVVIDSISHGGGTPQNEALEKWKSMKMMHDAVVGGKAQELYRYHFVGDTVAEKALRDSLRDFNEQFRLEVVDVANILGKGTAYDVLMLRYGK